MQLGQADGVQCRTVEVFESFGLADELLKMAYHVLEVAFWSADEDGKLTRTRRTADTMPGLSHQPHVILNQAIMNGFLLKAMDRFNGQAVEYGYAVKSVQVNSTVSRQVSDTGALNGDVASSIEVYPVTVIAEKDGVEEVFEAKYVLVGFLIVAYLTSCD